MRAEQWGDAGEVIERFKREEMVSCEMEVAAHKSGSGDPQANEWDWNSRGRSLSVCRDHLISCKLSEQLRLQHLAEVSVLAATKLATW
jgi:hypothetical protein